MISLNRLSLNHVLQGPRVSLAAIGRECSDVAGFARSSLQSWKLDYGFGCVHGQDRGGRLSFLATATSTCFLFINELMLFEEQS